MVEYIEREAALSAQNKSMNLSECRKRLERIPAADVRPVVLCRDCKHYESGWCHRVHNPAQYRKTTDDWFCADGVKMEES